MRETGYKHVIKVPCADLYEFMCIHEIIYASIPGPDLIKNALNTKIGDKVRIRETRPISKTVNWILIDLLKKSST